MFIIKVTLCSPSHCFQDEDAVRESLKSAVAILHSEQQVQWGKKIQVIAATYLCSRTAFISNSFMLCSTGRA